MDITSYELLVGTVEEFVLGYRISRKLKQKGEYELTQSFTSRYWATSSVVHPDPHSFWSAGSALGIRIRIQEGPK
jgi:hypothetical protein